MLRIEASPSSHALMDSTAIHLNADRAHDGIGLPQAFTGKGVVMGVMDIGFDLTHPNFYSRDTTQYRIHRFWDMLSADTVNSQLYVGRDYSGREELLSLGCSRDGHDQTHGTHTLGIAAGSGYQSAYRGIAPESDICIVANATTDDIALIDSADYYKYTFATDALGFKYIFDYAKSLGQPCVVSFSEGSAEDFLGYDQLYYEILDSLVGPGRILVAAAGNQGRTKSWFRKEKGQYSEGTFILSGTPQMLTTFKSTDDFTLRLVNYGEQYDTLLIHTGQVLEQEDSTLTIDFSHSTGSGQALLTVIVEAYPSCYNQEEMCYDVTLSNSASSTIGNKQPVSFEVLGEDADVEVYRVNGSFVENQLNASLHAGECILNIHSPGSAPSVICVGSTMYRQGIYNHEGSWKTYEVGGDGLRSSASSVGPTFDGRIKPDVMAPGVNIISSYSSFYLESHPTAADINWDVEHFTFNDRTYAWNSNSGTSMACPAAAGGIALWLQACPTLSPADVMAVIARTSRHNDPTLSYPNNYYGYGEIDIYAGLLDILGLSQVKAIEQRHCQTQLTVVQRQLTIALPQNAQQPFTVTICNLQGQPVYTATLPSGQSRFLLSLPYLPAGIYAVNLRSQESWGGSTLLQL
ncbi:MAG: S8 family peptidase [Prevotella sp.]|nr:S8 family peptidase [Prevotella sp.]